MPDHVCFAHLLLGAACCETATEKGDGDEGNEGANNDLLAPLVEIEPVVVLCLLGNGFYSSGSMTTGNPIDASRQESV